MQKLCWFAVFGLFFLISACHSSKKPGSLAITQDTVHIFPVTSFLKGQLRMLDTMPVTPLKLVTTNGKTDSFWLKREDIRKNALPFLTPLIDSATMSGLFTEKSFLDQTINAYTFTYDPKGRLPDWIHLTHWDVYMNPETNTIQRIYLVKEKDSLNAARITQLTWVVNKWFSIRTVTQKPGGRDQVKEEKMVWDFDD